jgi:hypothetical protein
MTRRTEDMEQIRAVIEETIHKTVNGKIDRMEKKLDEHIKKMQPVYEVYDTANHIGNFAMWISKVFLAVSVIIGSIIGLFKIMK